MDKQTFIDEITKKCGATNIDVSRMPKTPTNGYIENTWYDRTGPPNHSIMIANATTLNGDGCFIEIIISPPIWTNPPEKIASVFVYSPIDDPHQIGDIPDDFAEIALEKLLVTPYPTMSLAVISVLTLSNFFADVQHKKIRGAFTLAMLGYIYNKNYDLLMKKGEMDELGHFIGGSAIGMITPNPTVQAMSILGWEILETYTGMIRADKTEGLITMESFADTLKDIVFGTAGCYLASKHIK